MPLAPARACSSSTAAVARSMAHAPLRLKRSLCSSVGARPSWPIRAASTQAVGMTRGGGATLAPALAPPVIPAAGSHLHVDGALEIPDAADHDAALHPAGLALRVGDAGGDEGVGIGAPHLLLGALVVEREHPVVDAEVADVPRGGGAAARDLGRDIED